MKWAYNAHSHGADARKKDKAEERFGVPWRCAGASRCADARSHALRRRATVNSVNETAYVHFRSQCSCLAAGASDRRSLRKL